MRYVRHSVHYKPPAKSNLHKQMISVSESNTHQQLIQIPEITSQSIKYTLMRPYEHPQCSDMAVVIVYYNYVNSIRIAQNLLFVKQKLESAGIPLFIAEITFQDTPFLFAASPTIFQFNVNSRLFYKENAAAQIVQKLPDIYTKICIMDSDIIYDDVNWYDRISTLLDTYDVCQGFSKAKYLNITYSAVIYEVQYYGSGVNDHSGFVWAFRRTLTNQLLPEFALIGGGDSIIAEISSKKTITKQSYGKDIDNYTEHIQRPLVNGYLSDCTVYHLYHGEIVNRQYLERHQNMLKLLQQHGLYQLSDAVKREENGLYEFKPEFREEFNEFMYKYFNNRDDDGI